MSQPPAAPVPILRTQTVGEDQAIYIGPAILVSSKSTPGGWQIVENGRCTCKGFEIRGQCRHLAVAAIVAEQDRATASA